MSSTGHVEVILYLLLMVDKISRVQYHLGTVNDLLLLFERFMAQKKAALRGNFT